MTQKHVSERTPTHRRAPGLGEPLHQLLLLVDGVEIYREHRYTLAVVQALQLLRSERHARFEKRKSRELQTRKNETDTREHNTKDAAVTRGILNLLTVSRYCSEKTDARSLPTFKILAVPRTGHNHAPAGATYCCCKIRTSHCSATYIPAECVLPPPTPRPWSRTPRR